MRNDMIEDVIKSHYHTKYGPPDREAEYVAPDGTKVEIWKWDEKNTKQGVSLYATIGAFRRLNNDSEFCEFYLGIRPAVDDVAEAMAEVAMHGVGQERMPQNGESITLTYPLWTSTRMRSFLFKDDKDHTLIPVYQQDGITIGFIELVPLFSEELKFKSKYGEAKLWEAFAEKVVPYWNADRKSWLP